MSITICNRSNQTVEIYDHETALLIRRLELYKGRDYMEHNIIYALLNSVSDTISGTKSEDVVTIVNCRATCSLDDSVSRSSAALGSRSTHLPTRVTKRLEAAAKTKLQSLLTLKRPKRNFQTRPRSFIQP